MNKISALILTRNEANKIADCIKSLAFCDEVWVVDSGSDDETVAIARSLGAKVLEHSLSDFSQQRDWAIHNIDFGGDWILVLDADERATPELAHSIQRELAHQPRFNAYKICRKNFFLGKWIKNSGWYPDWITRLLKRGSFWLDGRLVHEKYIVDGPIGFVEGHIIHLSYQTLEEYFQKLNLYTTLEAKMLLNGDHTPIRWDHLPEGLFWRSLIRRGIEDWPFIRPIWMWFYMYILRTGFLDGREGFVLAALGSIYEAVVLFKWWELKNAHRL